MDGHYLAIGFTFYEFIFACLLKNEVSDAKGKREYI
jgi:hypothetical protein